MILPPDAPITVEITKDEIFIMVASTFHQYNAEKENSKFKRDIKKLHKKLSLFLKSNRSLYIHGELK